MSPTKLAVVVQLCSRHYLVYKLVFGEDLPKLLSLALLNVSIDIFILVSFIPYISSIQSIEFIHLQTAIILGLLKAGISVWAVRAYSFAIYAAQGRVCGILANWVLDLPPKKFEGRNTSEYVQITTKDVDFLREHYFPALVDILVDGLVFLALLGAIFVTYPVLIAPAFLMTIVMGSFYYFTIIKPVRALGEERLDAESARMLSIENALANHLDLYVLDTKGKHETFINDANHRLAVIGGGQKFLQSIPRLIFEIALVAGIITITFASKDDSNAFLAYAFSGGYAASRLFPSLIRIANSINGRKFAEHTANKLWKLLGEVGLTASRSEPRSAQKSIVISWPHSPPLEIEVGKAYQLMGRSGSGKSTILKSLIDSEYGAEIYVDSIRLTGKLGDCVYLPQKVSLLAGSVRDNIFLSAPSDETIEHAKELMVATSLVEDLDDVDSWLDRRLNSNTVGISGGQAQRIRLISALLRRPRVLLLDEALSGVELDLRARLYGLAANRVKTIVVVDHNLAGTEFLSLGPLNLDANRERTPLEIEKSPGSAVDGS